MSATRAIFMARGLEEDKTRNIGQLRLGTCGR